MLQPKRRKRRVRRDKTDSVDAQLGKLQQASKSDDKTEEQVKLYKAKQEERRKMQAAFPPYIRVDKVEATGRQGDLFCFRVDLRVSKAWDAEEVRELLLLGVKARGANNGGADLHGGE